MNTRPAWGLLFAGALFVIALLLSPFWLPELEPYLVEQVKAQRFPVAFFNLPPEAQDAYNVMYDGDEQKAIDFVAARLATPEAVDEPYLPSLDPDPASVQQLMAGAFVSIDPTRGATGTATLFRLSDGRRLLRLEGLDVIAGPDLHVLLSAYPNPTDKEDLDQLAPLQIDLGPLKGTTGNQNYLIEDPAFNPDNYVQGSVVIYSTRYDIVFSFASLTAVDSPVS